MRMREPNAILMYSIALLPDEPDATIGDCMNSFEVIERHKARAERREECMLRLFCVDAHRQHIGERQLVAGHKCDSMCQLANLSFSTFTVGADRIHVCIDRAACSAPPNFHHHRFTKVGRWSFDVNPLVFVVNSVPTISKAGRIPPVCERKRSVARTIGVSTKRTPV